MTIINMTIINMTIIDITIINMTIINMTIINMTMSIANTTVHLSMHIKKAIGNKVQQFHWDKEDQNRYSNVRSSRLPNINTPFALLTLSDIIIIMN